MNRTNEPLSFDWDEIKKSLGENYKKENDFQMQFLSDLGKVRIGEMSIAFFELKYYGMVITYGAKRG